MKIDRISSIRSVVSNKTEAKIQTINRFRNIIKSLQSNLNQQILPPKIQSNFEKNIPAAELINTQIKANNYLLNVELVSKVAESASSTFRKLQNVQ